MMMAECLNCLGNPGRCTCGNVKYDTPTPKQISRDDVSRLAAYLFGMGTTGADIGCTDRTKIREAAAMLRSLMDELEEATGYWKKLAVMEADARTRAEKSEAQLAAASERLAKAERELEGLGKGRH